MLSDKYIMRKRVKRSGKNLRNMGGRVAQMSIVTWRGRGEKVA